MCPRREWPTGAHRRIMVASMQGRRYGERHRKRRPSRSAARRAAHRVRRPQVMSRRRGSMRCQVGGIPSRRGMLRHHPTSGAGKCRTWAPGPIGVERGISLIAYALACRVHVHVQVSLESRTMIVNGPAQVAALSSEARVGRRLWAELRLRLSVRCELL